MLTCVNEKLIAIKLLISPVTISLFPTSIDLDPIFEKDRDLDRFRFCLLYTSDAADE